MIVGWVKPAMYSLFRRAKELKGKRLKLLSDSKTVVESFHGDSMDWGDCEDLFFETKRAVADCGYVVLKHIPRSSNEEADALAKKGIGFGLTRQINNQPCIGTGCMIQWKLHVTESFFAVV